MGNGETGLVLMKPVPGTPGYELAQSMIGSA
jgi:hypothetical protein